MRLVAVVALLCLAGALAPLTGCRGGAGPRAETAADSLALRIADAAGGLDRLASLPALRFDWAVVEDTVEAVRRRHLWDRAGDRTRIEWTVGEDSTIVALLSPAQFRGDAPEGQVALNGEALAGRARADKLVEAFEAHVNDTYWLLAPLKTLDPGVARALAPDSGAAVLALTFDNVGLTPGDRYWLHADPVSGAMTGWSFRLQDGGTGRWDWTDPQPIETPQGPLSLPTVKTERASGTRILTLPLPDPADETLFTDLRPRFAPGTLAL